MPDIDSLIAELQDFQLSGEDDELLKLDDLMDRIRRTPGAERSLRPVMTFVEQHREDDLGAPGPLVHFLESFFGKGYEAILLESVSRSPTEHSIWMLNPIINGTVGESRAPLVEAMRGIAGDERVDTELRELAERFLSS